MKYNEVDFMKKRKFSDNISVGELLLLLVLFLRLRWNHRLFSPESPHLFLPVFPVLQLYFRGFPAGKPCQNDWGFPKTGRAGCPPS